MRTSYGWSLCAALAVTAMGFLSTTANASVELDLLFAPNPSTPSIAEFLFDGTTLSAGPGLSDPYDLQLTSTLLPGGVLIPASFDFGDMTTTGPASVMGSYFTVGLTSSSFSFVDETSGDTVLSGTLSDVKLSGFDGTTTGFVAGTWTVTDGTIFTDNGIAIDDIVDFSGEFVWHLIDFDKFGVTGSTIDAFDANGGGQFNGTGDIVPEPASLALMGLGGLLIARRRR